MKSEHYPSFRDILGIAVICILIFGITFPAIQVAREASRRSACTNRLKTLGEAMHQYHDVHNTLPGHKFGPTCNGRTSAFTLLLPLVGHVGVYDRIDKNNWQVPWSDSRLSHTPGPFCTTIPEFLCPSDTAGYNRLPFILGYNNYVFSHGDWIVGNTENFSRGAFIPETPVSFIAVTDGLANTLAMSERCAATEYDRATYSADILGKFIVTEISLQNNISTKVGIRMNLGETAGADPNKQDFKKCFETAKNDFYFGNDNLLNINRGLAGGRWSDGQQIFTIFNTIMPPNGPSCSVQGNDLSPLAAPPTSYHITGVNALLLDNQVRYIANQIDCGGDYFGHVCVRTGQSPFGVWGALGSISELPSK